MSLPHTPDGDIRNLIVFKLARVSTLANRMGQRLISQELGISLQEFRTLSTISYLGFATMTTLARERFLDHAQVSRTVRSLIAKDLVERVGSGTRGGVLRLTEKGQDLVETGMPFAAKQNERLVAEMPTEDIETLAGLVDDLLEQAKRMYAEVNGEMSELVPASSSEKNNQ